MVQPSVPWPVLVHSLAVPPTRMRRSSRMIATLYASSSTVDTGAAPASFSRTVIQ